MKYFYCLVALWMFVAFTGCGKEVETVTLPGSTSTVTVTDTGVSAVVSEVNDARLKQGQAPLVPGLVCSLYRNLSNALTAFPTSLPSAYTSWVYLSAFDQPDSNASDGLNVLPPALKPLYTSWYAVRCSGQLVVPVSDYYSFSLRSDDASLLYLDNSLLVDNNGLHGPNTVTGAKFLSRGIHSFRLDYLQGPGGSQSLQLNVPSELLYR